jgi:DNA-binding GntR family transcriptional regulator
MRNLILNGEIMPGEYLSERYLVDRLNMSRAPIRSVLGRLKLRVLSSIPRTKESL